MNQKNKNIIRLLCVGLCAAILFNPYLSFFSSLNNALQKRKQPDFATYTKALFQEQLSNDTISLHYTLAHPENYGIMSTEVSLGSIAEQDPKYIHLTCENIRSACKRFASEKLSTDDSLTCDILLYTLDQDENMCKYFYYKEPLNSINGIQAELPVLLAEYTFRSEKDVEDYLTLLSLVPEYFCEIIDFEEKKSAKGLFMSTFATDDILSQINALTSKPAFSCLTTTFPEKLNQLSDIDTAKKQAYIREHQALIKSCLIPAYKNLADCLTRLRNTSHNQAGLCYFKNGDDYYSCLVSQTTASNRSVNELDVMIKNERQSCMSQIRELIQNNSNILSDIQTTTLKWNTPEDMLEQLKQELQKDFPQAPENDYEVKTVEPAMQKFLSPAFYLTAPIDDPNNNNIYINPAYEHSDIETFTTLAHEGYPGHLYETVCSYEQNFCPLRHVMNFGGYTEGWATYVEMLSYSYAGLSPTLAKLLQLNASATLSLYASIDIGIHNNGWSRDDVYTFLSENGIDSKQSADHIFELVTETPANYLKYYVGYLEFESLKKDAIDQFGDEYNNRSFHRAIMSIGPAPFSIIKKYLPLYYIPEENYS